jgi:hypothetical protein
MLSAWDAPGTSRTSFAPARSAMKRCRATGMLRSWPPKTNQDGIVFHAGASVGSPAVRAVYVTGRWVALITAAWAEDASAANWWWKVSGRITNSLPPVVTG